MIAHCPHCGTAFRIVADQLRVRDGRVRCGVCRQVFDGHAALERARLEAEGAAGAVVEGRGAAPAVPAVPAPAPRAEPVVAAPWDDDDGPVIMTGREAGDPPRVVDIPRATGGRAEPRLGDAPAGFTATEPRISKPPQTAFVAAEPRFSEPSKAGFVSTEPRFTEPQAGFTAAEPRFTDPEPGFAATEPALPRERIVAGPPGGRAEPVVGLSGWGAGAGASAGTGSGSGAGTPPRRSGEFPARAAAPAMPAAMAPEPPPPRQMVASRPDAPLPPMLAADSRGGVLRLLWTLGFWLALLALLAQAIWWWRMPLAAYFPPLRAPLEILCQSVGCEVGYLRAPQRLAIVSSSVQPDVLGSGESGVQRLQLQATLRNRAPHAQPWPALEVILTDHGDAMVARRVVLPSVYLPAGLQRQPFEAGAEYQVPLALTVRGTPVSGYRLNLFFP